MVHHLLITALLFSFSLPTFALKGDSTAPINIESANQSLDLKSNVLVFSGNVIITQGSINIRADKVNVIRPNAKQGSEVVKAFGKPVKFSQQQENGKLVTGHSNELIYEVKDKKLTLKGEAYLEQLDSSVSSNQIIYLTEAQRIEATGGRVKTEIVPSQLQEKTGAPIPIEANDKPATIK